jgi:hypothetical protein
MKITPLTLVLILVFSSILVAEAPFIAVGGVKVVEAQTVQSTSILVSHFNVDLVYAYATGTYAAMAIVNFTRIPNQTISTDGVSDVYTLELYSNSHMIGSHVIGCTIGAGPSLDYMMGISMSIGHFGLQSVSNAEDRSGLTTWDIPYDPPYPSFVEPLAVKLIKTGWVVVEGNYTWSTLNRHEVIEEVHLVHFQDGYLYNNLVLQEQLIDPKHPLATSIPTSPTPSMSIPSPSPSITQKPVFSFESAPAVLATFVVVSVGLLALACAATLIYFRKRRIRPEGK